MLAPGYGNAARAFAIDTVAAELHRVPRRARLRRLAARLPGESRCSRRPHRVHRRRHRHPRLAGGDRRMSVRQTGAGLGPGVPPTASAGCRSSWRWAPGWTGVRSALFSRARRPPDPDAANRPGPGPRWPRCSGVGIERASPTTTQRRSTTARREADEALAPFRERATATICHRILFIYGDVFDHEQHQRGDDDSKAVPVLRRRQLTFFKHITRMIRAGHAVDAEAAHDVVHAANLDRSHPDHVHARRAQPDVPPRGRRRPTTTCAPPTARRSTALHVIPDYAHLDCWIGERADRDVFPIALDELERYNCMGTPEDDHGASAPGWTTCSTTRSPTPAGPADPPRRAGRRRSARRAHLREPERAVARSRRSKRRC